MKRDTVFNRIESTQEPWDFLVIGGGATGLGVAVDASSRGYRTLLVEQHDFAKGTSSRSTKLVHGGVRYRDTFWPRSAERCRFPFPLSSGAPDHNYRYPVRTSSARLTVS